MTAMDVENTDRANSSPLRRSRMCVISPSGGARNFFLPGHYRGTAISNGAHLMT